jgi:RNA polymerase sigma factor for flagellar operon FliA
MNRPSPHLPRAEPDGPEVLERFHAELGSVKPMVRRLWWLLRGVVEADDLASAGREGLLEAARRYDVGRGVPFRAYAQFRVRGAMLDAARRLGGIPRRSWERREERAPLQLRESARPRILTRVFVPYLDSEPEEPDDDVAVTATMLSAANQKLSAAMSDEVSETPEQLFCRAELLSRVARILAEVPGRESEVLERHYFQGHALDSIASSWSVNKSSVSRIHKRALGRLSRRLRRST